LTQKVKKANSTKATTNTVPIHIAAACWIDLLGYGAMIASAKFNPLRPKAISAVNRLRTFHSIVAAHSGPRFKTFTVNDGAVAYRDLWLKDRSVTYDFLAKSWEMFKRINEEEKRNGYAGARLVLAAGFRVLGSRRGIDHSTEQIISILERLQNRAIDLEQAKKEASGVRRSFDIEPQLQANFAFTKAYVAEKSGKKGGLPGSNFYIDSAFFAGAAPAWLEAGPSINWSSTSPKMTGRFFRVRNVSLSSEIREEPAGIRNGSEIAQYLSRDRNVLAALRRGRK
jgi:hypothetical protein